MNKKIVGGGAVLAIVTIMLLGITYAFYKTQITGNTKTESLNVTSKKISVEYQDNDPSVVTNQTVQPGSTIEKTFKVVNTGDEAANYSIKISNVTNNYNRQTDWTYKLENTEEVKLASTVSSGSDTEIASGSVPATESYIVGKETVDSNHTKTYKLTITYANPKEVSQNEDQGKTLKFKIDIDEETTTLKEAVLRDEHVTTVKIGTTSKTDPGKKPSEATEKELVETPDDYGNSHIYRGKVDHNYVSFAKMCWRIVRVDGNGNIKLALANEGDCNSTSTSSGYIHNNGSLKTQAFKSEPHNDIQYARYTLSDIKKTIDEWYEDKIKDGNDKIVVNAEWCQDMSVSSTTSSYVYFGARKRIYPATSANPSLMCNFTSDQNVPEQYKTYKSEKFNAKVGLLTADELAFAGSSWSGTNNYYLKDEASSNWYWLLSPSNFYLSSSLPNVFSAYSSGYLSNGSVGNVGGAVRPAVVLQSGVAISGGDGSKGKPYIIKSVE